MSTNLHYCKFFALLLILAQCTCSDITNLVFGSRTDGMPAAFGDFNSDELTDVFVLTDNGKTLEILLAHEEEPLLRSARPFPLKCTYQHMLITSVVPGDFDGDALMDVMVTTRRKPVQGVESKDLSSVHILWGGGNTINCTHEEKPMIRMKGQPLAMDYNQDMIVDLFGVDQEERRVFWVFNDQRTAPDVIVMEENRSGNDISYPHANAFLDLNGDYMADLFITTNDDFEVWMGSEYDNRKFIFNHTIHHPRKMNKPAVTVGQSIFIDVELEGRMYLVTPACFDEKCLDSALMIYADDGVWYDLQVDFNHQDTTWGFYFKPGRRYTNTITLHSGDFNMDGYPDILVTLAPIGTNHPQAFLLENIPSPTVHGKFKRSYKINWDALAPFRNGSAMATFFDFYQDGTLDVILVTTKDEKEYKAVAFKNSLDYDANFVKVMVLTGLTNKNNPTMMGRVGKKRRTYGTNLPGPRIAYRTTTQDGNLRHGVSAQLPQSAHFSLNLPYTIFGLGRTPNFVDALKVGLSNHSRDWQQIIPNSQMVVIPWPTNNPSKWKAQLFVTPSKLILMSVAALTGVCGLITIIIGALYWKERQEDKKERMSESHRFFF